MSSGDVTRDGRGEGPARVGRPAEDGLQGGIGPYRQIARLGEGGMGVVYRGADPAGRDVAIKVLQPDIADDPTALRRLAREVDMMRRVRSPHVADVLDADVTADRPYVVTRFVPGRPLDEVVALRGPLRAGDLHLLALGLAKALVAVHEAGAVHRDLKPSNVMIVDGEPVVIDFGIAQAPDSARLTRAGMFTGAPGYVAPEVLDDERATSASDVHAWAATVAFAATGRPAFGQGSLEAVFSNILSGRAELTGVPEPLLGVLRWALARDPRSRPSAAALVETISGLDLGQAPGPPGRHPHGPPYTEGSGPGPRRAPGSPRPSGPAGAPPASAGRLAVAPAWSRLFAYLVVATVVSITIMMPVAGIVLALAGVFVLHAGDAASGRPGADAGAFRLLTAPLSAPAALLRAAVLTALTVPYAAVFAVLITLGLIALVVVGVHPNVLGACAWGTGASVYVLWAGPGVHAPRRHLVRVFGAVAPEPGRIALVSVLLGTLAFVAVVGAVSLTPSFAPMYGLEYALAKPLDRLVHALD